MVLFPMNPPPIFPLSTFSHMNSPPSFPPLYSVKRGKALKNRVLYPLFAEQRGGRG